MTECEVLRWGGTLPKSATKCPRQAKYSAYLKEYDETLLTCGYHKPRLEGIGYIITDLNRSKNND